MTIREHEILIYRSKKFFLKEEPLSPFINQNEHIHFTFPIPHCRGYQGHWLLKDDLLYITDLESDNYSFKDIFNTEEPVLAYWYSGILKFSGILNFKYGLRFDLWDHYPFYCVWLKLENGKVLERRIVQSYQITLPFSFGKYLGKTFNEILYGKIINGKNTPIREYIQCMVRFIIEKDFPYSVQCGQFELDSDYTELTERIRGSDIEYSLTENSIAISSKVLCMNSDDNTLAERLSLLLEKIFLSDFMTPITLSQSTLKTAHRIADESLLINPDLSYLNLVLISNNSYTIEPKYLSQVFSIKYLKSFKIKRLNKTTFEYEPILETKQYVFPEITQIANKEKIMKAYKAKYDNSLNEYTLDISNEAMIERFGFYLDETYTPTNNNDEVSKVFDDDNFDYRSSRNWLIDATDSNDPETMKDVYWNLD